MLSQIRSGLLEIKGGKVENLCMLDKKKWQEVGRGSLPRRREVMAPQDRNVWNEARYREWQDGGVGLQEGRRSDRRDLPLPLTNQQDRRKRSSEENGFFPL